MKINPASHCRRAVTFTRMLEFMHPVATGQRPRRTTRSGSGRKRSSGLAQVLRWWPLLLALVATPFAVRAASVLVLSGPGALRLLYPFVALVQTHAFAALAGSLAPEQLDTLAEWTMWAQFPVYGLIALLMGLWRGMTTGLFAVLLLHVLAVILAMFLAPAG